MATSTTSPAVLIAQAVGVTAPFFASGFYFCSSFLAAQPTLTLPNNLSTPIFSNIYHRGLTIVGPLSALPFLANAYLAYAAHQHGALEKRNLYGAAAVGCISTIVFTTVFMLGGIGRLNAIAASPAEQEKVPTEVVRGLLRTWTGQNYVRAALALGGGVASVVGTLG